MPLVPDAPDEPIKTVHFPKTPMDSAIDHDDQLWAMRTKHERRYEFWFWVVALALITALVLA